MSNRRFPDDVFEESWCRLPHARSLELGAATRLTRLWQSQDKPQDVYALLEPVHGWFTEGFDTVELRDAKTLLIDVGE